MDTVINVMNHYTQGFFNVIRANPVFLIEASRDA
jgi:hypothetical protein